MICWLRLFARKVWLLAVALVIGLAILVQTGRILSPQVEEYRPQISDWLSQRLGAPVEMQGLSLRWQALEVALQVDGLRLGEKGEVHMGYGLFHLDLLASLWNRELVWKNLQVDDFSAQLSRTADGGWHIDGFPPAAPGETPRGEAGQLHLGDPARIFLLGPKVQVRNASFTLRLPEGQAAQIELPQVLLENSGSFHRLSARAFISRAAGEPGSIATVPHAEQAHGETLRLVLEGRGNPRSKSRFSLNGYLQLNELLVDEDIVALLHQLTPLPEKYHWNGRKLAQGRLWLKGGGKQGYRLLGRMDLARAGGDVPEGDETPSKPALMEPLQSLSGDISGNWQPEGSWQLALQSIRVDWRDLEMPPLNLQARGSEQTGLQLSLDSLELAAWSQILQRLECLPEHAAEWLEALEPSGQLNNIQLARSADGQITLGAQLHDIAAGAHRGAPAVEGLDGYLQLNGANGRVELNSGEGFSAYFPQLYKEPFRFHSARGTVAWNVDREGNAVTVNSGRLQLHSDEGEIAGQFLLELPFVPHSRAVELTLALGLRDAPVTAQEALVPYTLSDDLRDWLNRGLGESNPGRVTSAGFVYRGSSYREGDREALLQLGRHPERQTVQLAANLAGGELDYARGWPAAREVDARLLVDDDRVVVNASKAKLWNIDARQIEVGVTPSAVGEGSLLGVRAQLSGPAADGLKLLRQSPLRERLGTAFDDWKLDGGISGELTLSQPLGGAPLPARQNVELELQGGALSLQDLRLDITGLGGRVHYDSDAGLEGTRLSGDLWGRQLEARVQHLGAGEMRDTQVVVTGRNSAAAVGEWSGRPEMDWLEGDFDYRALVTIPAQAKDKPYSAVLELTSDLAGVSVKLPAPLGKLAEDKTHFVLRVPVGAEGSLYHLDYGEHLQGRFWKVDGQLERAAIALNAEARLPGERSLAITGDLPRVDLSRWRQLLAVYDGDGRTTGETTAPEPAPLPVTLDLSTDRLQLGAAGIDHIHLQGRGLGADWQLQFDSEAAAGRLSGVLGGEAPLQLKLSHLRLPALEKRKAEGADADGESGPAADPLAGYDFADLPQVDFSTESLRLGEEDFGRWSFHLRPSPDRLVVSDIRGALRGVLVEGRGEGANRLGAQLMWMRAEDGSESSQFIGRLRAGDLAYVQRQWGQEPAIESESATFDTALRWDGSPARVAGNLLSGDLKIDIRKGRFLRASDNAGSAVLRLLSLFNFDTWARRLRLDFSDLYQSGMAFDRVRGEVLFEGDGQLLIAVPIQVEGPTSELQMAGRVNLKREDLNLTLVATLPVSNNLALVAALAGGLPAAAGVYLISKAFKKQMNKMASVSYRISGDWSDPQVRFDRLFDDEGARRQGSVAEQQINEAVRARGQPDGEPAAKASQLSPPPAG
ncbi:YhdP family protein [Microbulbifer rhizosphaerae]|uniref:Uncharacterized protein (TIGR02099 family) n=1 Tax=Microbulbifer rhizosphaerae TaxID=1562603 RepID=A0A7W4Z8L9_9GAMM|nr:YhdP family protein [Microbulbifer rhizosphaerae]MBB3059354.1 uncharacterized protein (TIGR02099 family) [Microbulbifer rhizosphaerae]